RRHAPLLDHFADRLAPGRGVVVVEQRHGTDLPGAVALLAVVLEDARHLLRVSHLAGLLRLYPARRQAPPRLRGRRRDRLAGEDFAQRLGEVAARRLCPREADAVLVVDAAAVAHLALAVEDERFRRPLRLELVGDDVAGVLQDGEGQLVLLRVLGDPV